MKGSFTGAVKDRLGRFELADGGTLFLDEVGEIPVDLQSKLLRVLQEGEFERIGDSTSRKVDVRVVSATNRNLPERIVAGAFRQDLYYRLSVFPIEAPPLRDRIDDVEALSVHFVRMLCEKHGFQAPRLAKKHMTGLENYDWPGNVRELQHVIERALILSSGGRSNFGAALADSLPPATPKVKAAHQDGDPVLPMSELKRLEERSIRTALKRAGGRVYGADGAAELLGMKPTTLASRMKTLGIEKS